MRIISKGVKIVSVVSVRRIRCRGKLSRTMNVATVTSQYCRILATIKKDKHLKKGKNTYIRPPASLILVADVCQETELVRKSSNDSKPSE